MLKKQTKKPTKSFSAYLLRPDALIIAGHPTTPKCLACIVEERPLDSTAIKAWFKQAITPLVGEAAAGILDSMIGEEPEERGKDFIEAAIKFRKKHFK